MCTRRDHNNNIFGINAYCDIEREVRTTNGKRDILKEKVGYVTYISIDQSNGSNV